MDKTVLICYFYSGHNGVKGNKDSNEKKNNWIKKIFTFRYKYLLYIYELTAYVSLRGKKNLRYYRFEGEYTYKRRRNLEEFILDSQGNVFPRSF